MFPELDLDLAGEPRRCGGTAIASIPACHMYAMHASGVFDWGPAYEVRLICYTGALLPGCRFPDILIFPSPDRDLPVLALALLVVRLHGLTWDPKWWRERRQNVGRR